MEIHDLQPGSDAWLAFRRAHRPASMAAVMLGRSPYMTRSAYLDALTTGVWPEPSPIEQANFDAGHRAEALMRPIVEKFIGQDLYPIVASSGSLSASMDGFFEDEKGNWENKLLNQDLEAALPISGLEFAEHNDARALPQFYRDQMEQQCLVSGVERVLFTADRFADDGTLLDVRACWYESDMDLAIEIAGGWKQFDADLITHKPIPRVEKVQAEAVEAFPMMRVELKGDVSVIHNLGELKPKLQGYLQSLPKKPADDQDFANIEHATKRCKALEKAIEAEEARALNGSPNIAALRAALAEISKIARDYRLAAEKVVDQQKTSIKAAIVKEHQAIYDARVREWNEKIGRPLLSTSKGTVHDAAIPEEMAGKKSVNGWREGAAKAVNDATIKLNTLGAQLQVNLASYRELCTGQEALFADLDQLLFKDGEAFRIICGGRISDAKEREEKRLAAARAQAEAETTARLQREQQEREAAEARQRTDTAAANTPIAAPAAPAAHAGYVPLGADVLPMPSPAPAQHRGEPTLTLTRLCEKLGFNVTAAFLEKLGIPAKVERTARLYHEQDLERICLAIRGHLRSLIEQIRESQREAA